MIYTKKPTDILDRIIEYNKFMNDMKYKQPKNFVKNYRSLTPQELENNNGGVCWDYVIHEANYFRTHFPSIKYTCYYHEFIDGKGDPSHTFILFTLRGSTFWFESSWKNHRGIYEFKDEKTALSFILDELIGDLHPSVKYTDDFFVKYNGNDPKLRGLSCEQFMEYMHKLQRYNFSYKSNSKYENKYP